MVRAHLARIEEGNWSVRGAKHHARYARVRKPEEAFEKAELIENVERRWLQALAPVLPIEVVVGLQQNHSDASASQ